MPIRCEDKLNTEMRRLRIGMCIGNEREMVQLTVEGIENFPFIAANCRTIFRKRIALVPTRFIHKLTEIAPTEGGNLQPHCARG